MKNILHSWRLLRLGKDRTGRIQIKMSGAWNYLEKEVEKSDNLRDIGTTNGRISHYVSTVYSKLVEGIAC